LPAIIMQQEGAATNAARLRFDEAEDHLRSDRGVDRRTARSQHRRPRFARQRVCRRHRETLATPAQLPAVPGNGFGLMNLRGGGWRMRACPIAAASQECKHCPEKVERPHCDTLFVDWQDPCGSPGKRPMRMHRQEARLSSSPGSGVPSHSAAAGPGLILALSHRTPTPSSLATHERLSWRHRCPEALSQRAPTPKAREPGTPDCKRRQRRLTAMPPAQRSAVDARRPGAARKRYILAP
jgi:hypothetical protein